MKVTVEQLTDTLAKGLAPVYLLSGDEPLQITEAGDAIRAAARASGYRSRELLYAETAFDWSQLRAARDEVSLFGEPRVLDLRLTAKPDKVAAAALAYYAERPPDDIILLVTLPKLSPAEQKTHWFQSLEQRGVSVQVWPIEGEKLLRWLDRRLNACGLLADQSGLRLLAGRIEGNLLAAAQEIEKLRIFHGSGKLSDQQIRDAVADSSRFDVYDLADSVLRGQSAKSYRILQILRGEGVASPVILWSLTREIRVLLALHGAMNKGRSFDAACAEQQPKIWDSRRPLFAAALHRLPPAALQAALCSAAHIDRVIKGEAAGDPWHLLATLCLSLTRTDPERDGARSFAA